MRYYLDASVAFHAVLPGGDGRARRWLDHSRHEGHSVFSSTLLELELTRTVRRERLSVASVRPLVRRINLVSISDGVLRVAGAIEPHVKSLDAIHLATCLMLGSGIVVVTHDSTMTSAAGSLGFACLDPLGQEPAG